MNFVFFFSACRELRERDWDLLNRAVVSDHYNQSGTRLYLGLSVPRLFWRGRPGSKVSRLGPSFVKKQLCLTKYIAYYQLFSIITWQPLTWTSRPLKEILASSSSLGHLLFTKLNL